jgi:chromosome segregation ATPase
MGKFTRYLESVEHKCDRLLASVNALLEVCEVMSAELDNLKTQVASNRDLTQSAVTLIQGLAAQIEAAKNDPAAIQALADDLRAQDTALGDALKANTPAQPAGGTAGGPEGGTSGPPAPGAGVPAAGRP